MHKYLVEITETLQRQFDVEAASKEEAEKIANMMYREAGDHLSPGGPINAGNE